MRIVAWMIGASLALVAATGYAAVYRWVDAHGVVHYSDVPVSGAHTVDPDAWESSGPSSGGSSSRTTASKSGGAQAPTGASDKSRCKLARQQLDEYEHASELVRRNAFGEQTKLDTKQRAHLIAQARVHVRKYCDASG